MRTFLRDETQLSSDVTGVFTWCVQFIARWNPVISRDVTAVFRRCVQFITLWTQLSRDVTAVILHCLAWSNAVTAQCLQFIARWVQFIVQCIKVITWCITVIARCNPHLAQCGHHQFWNKRPTITVCQLYTYMAASMYNYISTFCTVHTYIPYFPAVGK